MGDHSNLVESFTAFADRLPENGATDFCNKTRRLIRSVKFFTYGLSSKSDVYADDISLIDLKQQFKFTLWHPKCGGSKLAIARAS